MKAKIIRIGMQLLLVVFSVEAASRLALATDHIRSRVQGMSDSAWRLDWVRRHRRGLEIYYPWDAYHPVLGWTLRADFGRDGPDGAGDFSSNSMGLRGSMEYSVEKTPGRKRIVLLGDSFTFGEEVRDAETYARRLQNFLPGADVLNFGVHGFGHDQMLLRLREDALDFEPDVVVVGIVADDMRRNLRQFRDFAKPRFELVGGRLSLRNVPVPSPDEVLASEWMRPRFLDLLDMLYEAYRWKTGINRRRMSGVTEAILDAIVEDALEVGAVTVFMYLPHSEELTRESLTLDAEEFFTDYCRRRAAYCLNTRPAFLEAIDDGVRIKTPGHWHGAGHELVAERLAEYLVQRGLVMQ